MKRYSYSEHTFKPAVVRYYTHVSWYAVNTDPKCIFAILNSSTVPIQNTGTGAATSSNTRQYVYIMHCNSRFKNRVSRALLFGYVQKYTHTIVYETTWTLRLAHTLAYYIFVKAYERCYGWRTLLVHSPICHCTSTYIHSTTSEI